MTEEMQKKEMVALAQSLYQRGYSVGGAGNLSCRLSDGTFLVTPTGSSLGRLTSDKLSIINAAGEWLAGEKPSKEAAFHLAIYNQKPDCGAIVHLHSTYLTALSCLDDLEQENALRPFTPYYVMRVGKLPVIPYYRPGSPEIARELAERATTARAFLLANHGVVVTGENLLDAADNSEELEETAKLFFLLRGENVRYLTAAEIADLSTRGK